MITTTQPRPAGRRGFTTIELLVCLAIIGILMTFLLPSVQHARESARQMTCKFNLRQLMLATQSFESAHRRFPIGVSHKAELLPYLEQTAAHRVLASGNEAHNSPGPPNIFWKDLFARPTQGELPPRR